MPQSKKKTNTKVVSKKATTKKATTKKALTNKAVAGNRKTAKTSASKKISAVKAVDQQDVGLKAPTARLDKKVLADGDRKTSRKVGVVDSHGSDSQNGKPGQKKRGWRDIEALTERARLKSLLTDIWHEDIDLDSDIFGDFDQTSKYYTDDEEIEIEDDDDDEEDWEEFEEDED